MKRTTFWIRFALTAVVLLALWGCSGGRGDRGGRGGPELVQGGVIFRLYEPDAKRVYIVGTFNNWSPRSDPMVDRNGDGEYSLFYPLEAGRYEYKFVVDGTRWMPDPKNVLSVPDGFDGRNSVIQVPKR